MRIGIFLDDIAGPHYLSRPLDVLLERGCAAEEAGFESAWVPHVPMSVDAMVALTMLARETEAIELGSAVIPIQTRHPVAMAQEAATAQDVAGGRITLGLGVSHQVIIEQMLGLPYDRPAAQMREYLAVLTQLFTTGRARFAGEHYRVEVQLNLPGFPLRRSGCVPVLIAGLGPVMLGLAGSQTDGTILWMADERAIEEHVLPRITEAAEAAKRTAPRVAAGVGVCVCDDADAARAAAAETFGHYGSIPSYARMLERSAADPGDVAVTGGASAVRRRLRSLAAAGVTDLVAFPFGAGDDPERSLCETWDLLSSLAPTL